MPAKPAPATVKDGLGETVINRLRDPIPLCPVLLITSSERASPQVRDVVTEGIEGATVCRHRMLREEAVHDLLQPVPAFGDWRAHPPQINAKPGSKLKVSGRPGSVVQRKMPPSTFVDGHKLYQYGGQVVVVGASYRPC